MRLGLLARADNRGLGTQTWELYRHLHPDRTVVVDMSDHNDYPLHLERFPGAPVVRFDKAHRLVPSTSIDWLLEGIDVLLTAETPYDFGLLDIARSRGVRTAVVVNPEFYRYWLNPELARPDLVIVPTTWRIDEIPGAVHIAGGVDRERLPFHKRTKAATFLHIAGHPAMGDRAGTRLLVRACWSVTSSVRLVIRAQRRGAGLEQLRNRRSNLTVEVITDDVDEYWKLYAGADVLVAPRRYGGQSLPVNEALSTGMPVIALDRDPERSWGGVTCVAAHRERSLGAQSGPLESFGCRPPLIASAIDRLASRPDLVTQLSMAANDHAAAISWDVVALRYLEALAALL